MSQVSKLLNGHEGKNRNMSVWKGQHYFDWGHYLLSSKLRELNKLIYTESFIIFSCFLRKMNKMLDSFEMLECLVV